MKLSTKHGIDIDSRLLSNYLTNLVNLIYKILPLRESGEDSLVPYMESLEIEMLGCSELIEAIHQDRAYLTIISIVEYLSTHSDFPVKVFKREVFKAINLCNKLKERYCELEG